MNLKITDLIYRKNNFVNKVFDSSSTSVCIRYILSEPGRQEED